jgi:uncharacterized protein
MSVYFLIRILPMAQKLQFKIPFDLDLDQYLKKNHPLVDDYRLISKSLDARGAGRGKKPICHYCLETIGKGESFEVFKQEFEPKDLKGKPPIIIGAGPAGLFCALRLAEYGVASIILERGAPANERMKHISRHWRRGVFDKENNVCFGEGGAGLFSDGKLITRVKSPHIKYVMNKLVEFGAPKEVAYVSNPHLGSNKIRALISKITDHLRFLGHEIRYHQKVEKLLYRENSVVGVELKNGDKLYSDHVILAAGHSAHEMYHHLEENLVSMKQKDFAVGVRIEHFRREMDKMQFGDFAGHENLGTARYRLSYHDHEAERGTYSFCMCPGGYVLSSGTDEKGIVVNGMSNFAQNSPWSNAALVVTIKSGRDFSSNNLLSGLDFQKNIENHAFNLSSKYASGKEVPAQTIEQFLSGKAADVKNQKHSCPSGVFSQNLDDLLPEFVTRELKTALGDFDKKIKGFSSGRGVLMAPETRTSAPVNIQRDKQSLVSTSHTGLYPCGEGAGHAGGITSAAVDGINVAESIINQI